MFFNCCVTVWNRPEHKVVDGSTNLFLSGNKPTKWATNRLTCKWRHDENSPHQHNTTYNCVQKWQVAILQSTHLIQISKQAWGPMWSIFITGQVNMKRNFATSATRYAMLPPNRIKPWSSLSQVSLKCTVAVLWSKHIAMFITFQIPGFQDTLVKRWSFWEVLHMHYHKKTTIHSLEFKIVNAHLVGIGPTALLNGLIEWEETDA